VNAKSTLTPNCWDERDEFFFSDYSICIADEYLRNCRLMVAKYSLYFIYITACIVNKELRSLPTECINLFHVILIPRGLFPHTSLNKWSINENGVRFMT
jgi:hypothetical protein